MKFNELLTEAIIDNLSIVPIDKGILKTYHLIKNNKGNYGSTTWDLSDGERIYEVSKLLAINDYDKLFRLLKFYNKYSTVLFEDIDEEDLYPPLDFRQDETEINAVLSMYYYDNYVGKNLSCFPSPSLGSDLCWYFDIMGGSIMESIIEEATSIELYLNDVQHEGPSVVTFLNHFSADGRELGFDVITFDDDFLEYNREVNGGNLHDEVIRNGYISMSPPKDLKNETLKKYFDTLLKKIDDFLKENVNDIIERYLEYKLEGGAGGQI